MVLVLLLYKFHYFQYLGGSWRGPEVGDSFTWKHTRFVLYWYKLVLKNWHKLQYFQTLADVFVVKAPVSCKKKSKGSSHNFLWVSQWCVLLNAATLITHSSWWLWSRERWCKWGGHWLASRWHRSACRCPVGRPGSPSTSGPGTETGGASPAASCSSAPTQPALEAWKHRKWGRGL